MKEFQLLKQLKLFPIVSLVHAFAFIFLPCLHAYRVFLIWGYNAEFTCVYFTNQKFYLKRFIEISHKYSYAINIKCVRSFRQTTHFFQGPQSVSTHPTSISINRFCNCGYFALTTLNKFTKMNTALICSAYNKGFLKRRLEIL